MIYLHISGNRDPLTQHILWRWALRTGQERIISKSVFSEAKWWWFSIRKRDKRIITDQSPAWCLWWLQGVPPQHCHHTRGCHTLAGSLPWAWAVVACPSPLWFDNCFKPSLPTGTNDGQSMVVPSCGCPSSGGTAPVNSAREVTQIKAIRGKDATWPGIGLRLEVGTKAQESFIPFLFSARLDQLLTSRSLPGKCVSGEDQRDFLPI